MECTDKSFQSDCESLTVICNKLTKTVANLSNMGIRKISLT